MKYIGDGGDPALSRPIEAQEIGNILTGFPILQLPPSLLPVPLVILSAFVNKSKKKIVC
jgi:hypothetical protein